jgi:hypothetical protein
VVSAENSWSVHAMRITHTFGSGSWSASGCHAKIGRGHSHYLAGPKRMKSGSKKIVLTEIRAHGTANPSWSLGADFHPGYQITRGSLALRL